MSLFNLLQFPLAMFPFVISSVVEASVSFGRLYAFLMNEELDQEAVIRDDIYGSSTGSSSERVSVVNGSFRWADNTSEPVIKNINLSVNDGMLLAIVGVYVS